MKKLRKKNQLLLTVLAVMIAVAGYLTYLPEEKETVPAMSGQEDSALMDISEEDILAENIALEQAQYTGGQADTQKNDFKEVSGQGTDAQEAAAQNGVTGESETGSFQESSQAVSQEDGEGETSAPGEAVLTWNEQVENRIAEAALNREQIRTRNEETLNTIINNKNLSEKQREDAAQNLMKMTENAKIESDIESILKSKGLAQTLVTISENGVEVLIGSESISDAEKAQIEDTVKREADVEISDIVISLMNSAHTDVVEEP